jgi:urease beta subunit|tara:strand:- start:542 stop:832 length:291 start_codon:yes stop_codon:yes gene_type:complete
MIPGEYIINNEDLEINSNNKTLSIEVINKGDRPIQVGSHYHFAEVNSFLNFNREIAKGKRLNIPSGTSIRFEPGQKKKINLVEYKGKKVILGFNTY